MKRSIAAALTLGLLVTPLSFASAQTADNPNPGSATSPMHGTHDKAQAVRVDNGARTMHMYRHCRMIVTMHHGHTVHVRKCSMM